MRCDALRCAGGNKGCQLCKINTPPSPADPSEAVGSASDGSAAGTAPPVSCKSGRPRQATGGHAMALRGMRRGKSSPLGSADRQPRGFHKLAGRDGAKGCQLTSGRQQAWTRLLVSAAVPTWSKQREKSSLARLLSQIVAAAPRTPPRRQIAQRPRRAKFELMRARALLGEGRARWPSSDIHYWKAGGKNKRRAERRKKGKLLAESARIPRFLPPPLRLLLHRGDEKKP